MGILTYLVVNKMADKMLDKAKRKNWQKWVKPEELDYAEHQFAAYNGTFTQDDLIDYIFYRQERKHKNATVEEFMQKKKK